MPTDDAVATETTETPTGATVTPSGGIVTRTDGSDVPVVSDWRASLPLELQMEKSLADVPDVATLARRFLDNHRAARNGIKLPGEQAKPEEVAAFRERMGVPASPDKYGITLPQPPAGQTWDKGMVDGFLGTMHAAHARPEVVQAALDHFVTYMAKQADREKAASASESVAERAAAVKALEAVWGPQGGALWRHHETRALMAIDTLMGDAPPEAVQRVKEAANDPEVAHAFSLLADGLLERGFVGEAEQTSASGGAGAAQAKADAIRDAAAKDPKHPLMDRNHPEHERTMTEYLALNAVAAGPRGREVVTEVRR